MIDPFSDAETLSRPDRGNLASVAASIVTSLIQQARFKPEDIALAYAESVYSRFLIAPVGPGPNNKRTVGQRAIASGALGGCAGFVDPSFLAYDFSLGRLNAHKFLAEHLALPVTLPPEAARPHDPNNPIFNDWTKDDVLHGICVRKSAGSAGHRDLPADHSLDAELAGHSAPASSLAQARGRSDYLESAIQARLRSVYELAGSPQIPTDNSWWKRALLNAYLWLGWTLYLRKALHDAAVNAVKDSLSDQGLMPPKA